MTRPGSQNENIAPISEWTEFGPFGNARTIPLGVTLHVQGLIDGSSLLGEGRSVKVTVVDGGSGLLDRDACNEVPREEECAGRGLRDARKSGSDQKRENDFQ